ncbi:phosphatase PAP2 family protein [Microbacterium phyllosphaerae]|uniref:phosphatase PAP2 family protein n=1 Tax=Microbacterium phyllosphaerae TaxID=124798 RepID=UPI000EA15614|nr:phosphatase PAP2 family protein [Microbacterium phyllosphaerae]
MTAAHTLGDPAELQDAAPVQRRRPRAMLWTALGLLAVFVLLGVGVYASPEAPWSQGLDDAWRGLIGVGAESVLPGTVFAQLFQNLGQLPGFALMMIVLPLGLVIMGRWRSALFVIAVQLAGPGLLSQLTKNLVDRPRPAVDAAAGLFGPLVQVDHGSFPSGHSVSMATIIITVFALIPASALWARRVWAVLGVLLAIGMVWQRTLINAHWFTDTCAGLIAGAAVALLLWWAFLPWLRRDHARRVWFVRRSDATG